MPEISLFQSREQMWPEISTRLRQTTIGSACDRKSHNVPVLTPTAPADPPPPSYPKAIGARNARESSHKRRDAGQQQLQSLIAEKKSQLERLRVEQESLERVLQDQSQFIENFVLQK